jgi:hypothetical protein
VNLNAVLRVSQQDTVPSNKKRKEKKPPEEEGPMM